MWAIWQEYAPLVALRFTWNYSLLDYRGEKALEVVKKVARLKFVHDFTLFKGINLIQLEKVELFI